MDQDRGSFTAVFAGTLTGRAVNDPELLDAETAREGVIVAK